MRRAKKMLLSLTAVTLILPMSVFAVGEDGLPTYEEAMNESLANSAQRNGSNPTTKLGEVVKQHQATQTENITFIDQGTQTAAIVDKQSSEGRLIEAYDRYVEAADKFQAYDLENKERLATVEKEFASFEKKSLSEKTEFLKSSDVFQELRQTTDLLNEMLVREEALRTELKVNKIQNPSEALRNAQIRFEEVSKVMYGDIGLKSNIQNLHEVNLFNKYIQKTNLWIKLLDKVKYYYEKYLKFNKEAVQVTDHENFKAIQKLHESLKVTEQKLNLRVQEFKVGMDNRQFKETVKEVKSLYEGKRPFIPKTLNQITQNHTESNVIHGIIVDPPLQKPALPKTISSELKPSIEPVRIK